MIKPLAMDDFNKGDRETSELGVRLRSIGNSTNMQSLLGGVIGDDCGSMTTQAVQHDTAVKRLSMREKLPGDRMVRFEKPCMWM